LSGSSIGITSGQEKVIDTERKGKEVSATEKTEPAPVTDKKFTPSLLDTAVSDISNISRRTDADHTANSEESRSKAKSETEKGKADPQKKD
jgi:hypothetical protein